MLACGIYHILLELQRRNEYFFSRTFQQKLAVLTSNILCVPPYTSIIKSNQIKCSMCPGNQCYTHWPFSIKQLRNDSLVSNPMRATHCNLLQTSPELIADAVAMKKCSFWGAINLLLVCFSSLYFTKEYSYRVRNRWKRKVNQERKKKSTERIMRSLKASMQIPSYS